MVVCTNPHRKRFEKQNEQKVQPGASNTRTLSPEQFIHISHVLTLLPGDKVEDVEVKDELTRVDQPSF